MTEKAKKRNTEDILRAMVDAADEAWADDEDKLCRLRQVCNVVYLMGQAHGVSDALTHLAEAHGDTSALHALGALTNVFLANFDLIEEANKLAGSPRDFVAYRDRVVARMEELQSGTKHH